NFETTLAGHVIPKDDELTPRRECMTDAMEQLKTSLQAAPVIWKGDYPYFIHPVTDGVPRMDPGVLKAITELTVERVDWENIDLLLGIEAMGLPLTAPLSMATGIPLVIARKRSYGLDGEVEIDQSTGYSKGAMYLNDIKKGERIAIVDDVLSTGGTLEAVIEGVRRAGAEVTDVIAVIEKGEGLKRLQGLYDDIRIQSLVRLVMDGDTVVLLEDERP
ncbi:MAG: hypoxanthine/guanine phosphoribosyltransferase, partial [Poseidonia sp.]